jgi:hypothetical protein
MNWVAVMARLTEGRKLLSPCLAPDFLPSMEGIDRGVILGGRHSARPKLSCKWQLVSLHLIDRGRPALSGLGARSAAWDDAPGRMQQQGPASAGWMLLWAGVAREAHLCRTASMQVLHCRCPPGRKPASWSCFLGLASRRNLGALHLGRMRGMD